MSEQSERKDTTVDALNRAFSNYIVMALLVHKDTGPKKADKPSFEKQKNNCVESLELNISQNPQRIHYVTIDMLKEFRDLVKNSDFSEIDDVKSLYQKYYEILDEPYDEKKNF